MKGDQIKYRKNKKPQFCLAKKKGNDKNLVIQTARGVICGNYEKYKNIITLGKSNKKCGK